MKSLKRLVLNDYVELTDQQKKKILGGYDGGGDSDSCYSLTGPCDGTCSDKWDSAAKKWVKRECKGTYSGSTFYGCGCI